ncbi:MAG: histidinol-phosphate transaminase [Pseudomonadota bacterium]
MSGPQPNPNIMGIVPYKGGQKLAHGHKLSSNENPLGFSPKAKAAITSACERLEEYPDGNAVALRRAIGAKFGLDADRIFCGAGSDEIFQLLGQAYLSPGDEILQSAHGFLIYRLVAEQAGAATISAPETDLCANVDALLDHISARTKIVFLANPNNPTGTYIPYSEVKRLQAGLPENVLLVLDGAYAEYVRTNDYSAGAELAGEAPNVIMTRTFSKIHGLAGLRLGWGYGPQSVIDTLNRVRGPFNISAPAQAAGIAAIEDDRFVAQSIDHNSAELARISEAISAAGFRTYPSAANFVLVEFDDKPGRRAADADAFLRSRGLVVRDVKAYGLPNCLRVSVGTTIANDELIEAFTAFAAAT